MRIQDPTFLFIDHSQEEHTLANLAFARHVIRFRVIVAKWESVPPRVR